MRKIELIELIGDYLSGGDAPSDVRGRYHPEIISNHLSTAFKRVIFDTYLEAKTYSDYSLLDAWAASYEVDVADDPSGDKERGIAVLPYPPVQLPNGMGILQVGDSGAAIGSAESAFAYRETNSNPVFAALEINRVSTKPFFFLEQRLAPNDNKPYQLRIGKRPVNCNKITVKMIVPLENMDDYDPVAMPAGKETDMLAAVMDLMRTKPPEDTINDGKANQI